MKEVVRWICVNYEFGDSPYYSEETISYTRSCSIAKCILGTNYTWRHWRDKIGWRCVKIKITIDPI